MPRRTVIRASACFDTSMPTNTRYRPLMRRELVPTTLAESLAAVTPGRPEVGVVVVVVVDVVVGGGGGEGVGAGDGVTDGFGTKTARTAVTGPAFKVQTSCVEHGAPSQWSKRELASAVAESFRRAPKPTVVAQFEPQSI